jgi:hypothetical protein
MNVMYFIILYVRTIATINSFYLYFWLVAFYFFTFGFAMGIRPVTFVPVDTVTLALKFIACRGNDSKWKEISYI